MSDRVRRIPPNALTDVYSPSCMPGRIGQIIDKAVAIAQQLAEKRHAGPAKAMPDNARFRRSRSPIVCCRVLLGVARPKYCLMTPASIEPIERGARQTPTETVRMRGFAAFVAAACAQTHRGDDNGCGWIAVLLRPHWPPCDRLFAARPSGGPLFVSTFRSSKSY